MFSESDRWEIGASAHQRLWERLPVNKSADDTCCEREKALLRIRVRPFETALFSILMRRKNVWNACNLKHAFCLPLLSSRCLVHSPCDLWCWRIAWHYFKDELNWIHNIQTSVVATATATVVVIVQRLQGLWMGFWFCPPFDIHFSTLNPLTELNQCSKLTTTSYFTSPNNHLYCFSIPLPVSLRPIRFP